MNSFCSIRAKQALYHHGRKNLPYSTDLNPYTGCSHSCIYCYAHARKVLREGNSRCRIEFKENIAEILERELMSKDFSSRIINIGGSTDAYQESEKETAVMRDILRLMIKYRVPVIISTKSDLITRDLDLIKELSGKTYVNIAFSLSTMDREASSLFEPGASSPEKRINALKIFSEAGINSALHFFPVIPRISDTEEMIHQVASEAASSLCSYIMSGFLYLTGNIGDLLFRQLEIRAPELKTVIGNAYHNGRVRADIKKDFYSVMNRYLYKYSLETDFRKFIPERLMKERSANTINPAQPELPF